MAGTINKKTLLLCVLAFSLCAMASGVAFTAKVPAEGSVVKLESRADLEAELKENPSFVIQLTLEGCAYCEALNYEEYTYLKTHDVTIYEYEVPKDLKEVERAFLKERFGSFETYPAVYYVVGGATGDPLAMGADAGGFAEAMEAIGQR